MKEVLRAVACAVLSTVVIYALAVVIIIITTRLLGVEI